LYWDAAQLKIYNDFWNKYVKEVYRDLADALLRDGQLGSKVPQFWAYYTGDPKNYVYLYELMTEQDAVKPHQVPLNFMLWKDLYGPDRYDKLKSVIEPALTGR
jgi:hypothetical protein